MKYSDERRTLVCRPETSNEQDKRAVGGGKWTLSAAVECWMDGTDRPLGPGTSRRRTGKHTARSPRWSVSLGTQRIRNGYATKGKVSAALLRTRIGSDRTCRVRGARLHLRNARTHSRAGRALARALPRLLRRERALLPSVAPSKRRKRPTAP